MVGMSGDENEKHRHVVGGKIFGAMDLTPKGKVWPVTRGHAASAAQELRIMTIRPDRPNFFAVARVSNRNMWGRTMTSRQSTLWPRLPCPPSLRPSRARSVARSTCT